MRSILINFRLAKSVELIQIYLDRINITRPLVLNIKVNYIILERN